MKVNWSEDGIGDEDLSMIDGGIPRFMDLEDVSPWTDP